MFRPTPPRRIRGETEIPRAGALAAQAEIGLRLPTTPHGNGLWIADFRVPSLQRRDPAGLPARWSAGPSPFHRRLNP